MSDAILSSQNHPKLVAVVAFDRGNGIITQEKLAVQALDQDLVVATGQDQAALVYQARPGSRQVDAQASEFAFSDPTSISPSSTIIVDDLDCSGDRVESQRGGGICIRPS